MCVISKSLVQRDHAANVCIVMDSHSPGLTAYILPPPDSIFKCIFPSCLLNTDKVSISLQLLMEFVSLPKNSALVRSGMCL